MGVLSNPASEHIFNIRDKKYIILIYKDWARVFHKCVRLLMFVTTRFRCDIQTEVVFL